LGVRLDRRAQPPRALIGEIPQPFQARHVVELQDDPLVAEQDRDGLDLRQLLRR
jgi:hypothetical protein